MKMKKITAFVLTAIMGFVLVSAPADSVQAHEMMQEPSGHPAQSELSTAEYMQKPSDQSAQGKPGTAGYRMEPYQSDQQEDTKWDYEQELAEVTEDFIFHAIPSKDGTEARIYEVTVRLSGDYHYLHIPEMIGGRKVTGLGYEPGKDPEADFDCLTNILGHSVDLYHNSDGGAGLPRIFSIELPDSIREIGEGVFAGLDHLTEIRLPEQLLTVEDHLFYGCDSLEKVVLPDNLEELKGTAFTDCPRLKNIKLPSSNQAFWSKNGCIITKEDNALVCACSKKKTLNIPEGVKILKEYALSSCLSSTVNIPASVNRIEPRALQQAAGHEGNQIIKNVTVSKKNKTYAKDGQCIYHRKNQTLAVAVPDVKGVLRISEKVRYLPEIYSLVNCDAEEASMEKLVFPKQLVSISSEYGCRLLSSADNIYFTGKKPPKVKLGKHYSLFGYENVYVPKDSYKKYLKWYKKWGGSDTVDKLHTF